MGIKLSHDFMDSIPLQFFFFFLLNKYFIAQPEKGEKQKNWAKFHLYSKPAKSKKADLRWESA